MKNIWLIVILAACTASGFGQKDKVHKYYVTGYASSQDGGDCTHPALIAYGRNRIDALMKVGISPYFGGVTVWTAAEYAEMRREVGQSLDDYCKKLSQNKKPKLEAQP